MILKRYQYWGSEKGKPIIKWTDWFNYCENNKALTALQKNEKYQLLHPKLLNEFKVI